MKDTKYLADYEDKLAAAEARQDLMPGEKNFLEYLRKRLTDYGKSANIVDSHLNWLLFIAERG